jgi:hypothetical protein
MKAGIRRVTILDEKSLALDDTMLRARYAAMLARGDAETDSA